MDAIKDVVSQLLQSWQAGMSQAKRKDLEAALKKILTKKQFQHIRVKYFYKNTLGISVDSSPWLYQLKLEKEALLAKIKKVIPELKEVKFFTGEAK